MLDIIGPKIIHCATAHTYFVELVPGWQYTWAIEGQGALIIDGQGTHSVTITVGMPGVVTLTVQCATGLLVPENGIVVIDVNEATN